MYSAAGSAPAAGRSLQPAARCALFRYKKGRMVQLASLPKVSLATLVVSFMSVCVWRACTLFRIKCRQAPLRLRRAARVWLPRQRTHRTSLLHICPFTLPSGLLSYASCYALR